MALLTFIACAVHSQDAAVTQVSRDTAERVKDSGWWPTKGAAAREAYAGSGTCAECHRAISDAQATTPMFLAARRPEETAILRDHSELRFLEGGMSYSLMRREGGSFFSAQDKRGAQRATVELAVGNGEIGQTYLLKRNGTYLESRLSYFPGLHGLDVTPGHPTSIPRTLADALGTPLDADTAVRCFGCHTTASTVSGNFEPDRAAPGVGCEGCHGPGAAHIGAVRQGNDAAAAPLNPAKLSPVDSVDFCGACHRTPVDVALHMSEDLGLIGIRFQPYRLERSLCWGAGGDPRITCIACHDPHQPLVKTTASYDSKCLACHAETGQRPGHEQAAACTVAGKDCASCHMPKYELKPAHATFTDHYIRVVKPGSGFRD